MAKVTLGGRTYEVEVRGDTVVVDGREFKVTVRDDGAHKTVKAGDVQYRVQLPPEGERQTAMDVKVDYRPFTMTWEGRLGGGSAPAREARASGAAPRAAARGGITAQIAGRVTRIVASAGTAVKAGDVLIILEAMKMENEIKAPSDGVVKEIPVTEGQRVSEGDVLAIVE